MEEAIIYLAKLVYDYTIASKLADEAFIDQAAANLIKAFNLDDMVCQISHNKKGDLIASYDYLNKELNFNLAAIYKNTRVNLKNEAMLGFINLKEDEIYKINLSYINVVAHEIFHAIQYSKIPFDKDDIESRLLKLSFDDVLLVINNNGNVSREQAKYVSIIRDLESKDSYRMNIPSERMASIDAARVVKAVSSFICDKPYINNYLDYNLELAKYNGYQEYNCPTAYVMAVLNSLKNVLELDYYLPESLEENEDICRELAYKYELSLEDKLYYGMFINDEIKNGQLTLIKRLIDHNKRR